MKRCLLVFLGGSFRLGGQNNTSIGDPKSYEEQKQACMSHAAFCTHLENVHGVVPDVHINTYSTQFSGEMLQWYPSRETHIFHDRMLGYHGIIRDAVSRIQLEEEYEFVLFLRIDLFLKPDFFNVNVFDTRVCFSSVCFTPHHLHRGLPRVADLILLIPKNHFRLLRNRTISLYHDSYEYFMNQGLDKRDIGFFVDTFHDSDSQKDWNPLYKIVNRPETSHWHDRGRTIDEVFEYQKRVSVSLTPQVPIV